MPTYRPPHIPNFRRITRQFAEIAIAQVDEAVEEFAHEEVDLFVREIAQQVFPSFRQHPLTEAYARRKRYAGADRRVLMATHWYVDHIRVWRWRPPGTSPRRASGWRIGFHPTVRARDLWGRITDITLNKLARVHEYGSRDQRVPARPHWRPHLTAMQGRAATLRQGLRQDIVTEARRRIRWGP
jgi:hypothetical protein